MAGGPWFPSTNMNLDSSANGSGGLDFTRQNPISDAKQVLLPVNPLCPIRASGRGQPVYVTSANVGRPSGRWTGART